MSILKIEVGNVIDGRANLVLEGVVGDSSSSLVEGIDILSLAAAGAQFSRDSVRRLNRQRLSNLLTGRADYPSRKLDSGVLCSELFRVDGLSCVVVSLLSAMSRGCLQLTTIH